MLAAAALFLVAGGAIPPGSGALVLLALAGQMGIGRTRGPGTVVMWHGAANMAMVVALLAVRARKDRRAGLSHGRLT